MPVKRKYYLWLLLAVSCCHFVSAQTPVIDSLQTISPGPVTLPDTTFTVRDIVIQGNKKTKRNIILREIPFKTGEHYLLSELVKKFEDARRNLLNTTLFHEVVVALKSFDGYYIDVLVAVKERWYLFPLPYFKPVDRNINQWIIEQKASLSRVNYGAKILYYNATGRNDKLKLYLINGYTKQFSISYDRLYIDKKMKWGLNAAFGMGKNKEMNYNTINDKQAFLKDDRFLRSFFNASAELTYRKAIKTRHHFGIAYTMEDVSDTVVKLNPAYFPASHTRITFPEIYYIMSYNNFDYFPYPTKGYGAEFSFNKKGFSSAIDVWQVSAKGRGAWPTGPKSFFSLVAYGNLKLPFKQPYFNQRLLGYGDAFMQGYEYYVIDGVAAGYLKATFTRKIIKFDVRIPGFKKIAPQRVPFTIYAKIYGNTGYVHNPQPGENSLSNKMLYTGGVGIDIFTFYDFTLKLEWSFNQLGQNGLFLHSRKSFF
ncbi:MAG TPA: POTRA domain-containing protein [Chitinophagaceae bacterium]|nr:POTRA domain-containing protein [Chitinophagaceae bacterium]